MQSPRPRPGILEIVPYVGGKSGAEGKPVAKLSSNESPLGPSPKAAAAYRELAGKLHRYPDGNCAALRQALSRRHNLDPDAIVCGAGSDELIGLLVRAYAGPGDEVLYSAHGFLMYKLSALAAGAHPVTAPEQDLRADVDALLARVTSRTRIVFVANPNNPTGTYNTSAELEGLLREVQQINNSRAVPVLVAGVRVALAAQHHDVVARPAVGPQRGLGGRERRAGARPEAAVELARARRALEEVDARVAARDPVFAVVDAQAPQQAEQRIGGAGGQRDAGQVPLGARARQAGELGVDDLVVLACGRRGDRDLPAPLADLHHQWDVHAGRHVLEHEAPIHARQAGVLARDIALGQSDRVPLFAADGDFVAHERNDGRSALII